MSETVLGRIARQLDELDGRQIEINVGNTSDNASGNYAQQPEDHDPVNDQSEYPPDVFS